MVNHELWCQLLQKYWQEKDVSQILSLFSEEVIYYETPFDLLEDKSALVATWNEIKTQETITLTYKILCTEGHKCIANFFWKASSQTYDMIYEIVLDDTNKCTYFKQWFMCLDQRQNG